jgi:DNA-directed RNA polymerase specialized sigma24 family protein
LANYIEAARFTALFAPGSLNRNRRRISEQLHQLAWRTSQRFAKWHPNEQDLEDAAAEATLIALRKINCFDPRRPQANAFSYFSTVVMRAIARHLKRQHQRRGRECLMGDLGTMDVRMVA